MEIKIHRGLDQIGGCITEISTVSTKILIDFGEELSPHQEIDTVSILKDCNGVLFTHYHGDHIGLFKTIPQDVPVYLGRTAKQIFSTLINRIDKDSLPLVERFSEIVPLRKIQIGDIEVTPLLVDHSAFDAYMFLVKADGKTILQTGDFRGHGYRSRGLIPTLEKYVGKVDVLVTEGTCLSRPHEALMTERQLQSQAAILMKEKKYVFVLCSSTNIERIAAFYHANPRGKYFACDNYQKEVLNIVSASAAQKTSLYDFKRVVTYGDNLEIRFRDCGFCMLVRSRADHRSVIERYPPEERLVVYSMWKGYLSGEHQNESIRNFLYGIDYTYLHTSGHADAKTIAEVIDAVNPELIIPIHTENAAWFWERYAGRVFCNYSYQLK